MLDQYSAKFRCLPLQTLYNVRDLGGYLALDGCRTVSGRFLRADAPVRLNQYDRQLLLHYPVRTVIDLRSQSELRQQPHNLKDCSEISYFNIPLLGDELDGEIAMLKQQKTGNRAIDLSDLYIYILDNAHQAIGKVMNCLAHAPEGACFFNCSHGKDRTGLIAALLLLLAGVSEKDVIDDYKISHALLKPWFDTFIDQIPPENRIFFNTNPENMQRTLGHFYRLYQSAEAYMNHCGVHPATIAVLKKKLLVPCGL